MDQKDSLTGPDFPEETAGAGRFPSTSRPRRPCGGRDLGVCPAEQARLLRPWHGAHPLSGVPSQRAEDPPTAQSSWYGSAGSRAVGGRADGRRPMRQLHRTRSTPSPKLGGKAPRPQQGVFALAYHGPDILRRQESQPPEPLLPRSRSQLRSLCSLLLCCLLRSSLSLLNRFVPP